MGQTAVGESYPLKQALEPQTTTKFNGVPYIIQKGAEATYTPKGKKSKPFVSYYMDNAKIIKEGLESIGLETFGGENAPYIWLKTPKGMDSWAFFDKLLHETHIVGTPGTGFGPSGQGYFLLNGLGK